MPTPSNPRSARKTETPPPEADAMAQDCATQPAGDRRAMIAEAAFFIAQARGFVPGFEFDDWLAAERAIERHLDTADH